MNIKNVLPINLIKLGRKFNSFKDHYFYNKEIKKIRNSQVKIVKELRKKEVLNVIFLVIQDSVWKYEEVYSLLDKNPKFNVNVAVIPLVRKGKGEMTVYAKTLKYFEDNNYKVVKSFDNENDRWLDIKAITKPDIVFFTNPHKLTFDKYYIDNFTDKLTCYVPYSFQVSNLYQSQFNQPFHSKVWRQFYETETHKKIGVKYSDIKGANIIVTGYPGLDNFFNDFGKLIDPWIIKSKNLKRIIWAPHHTIVGQGGGLDYSSFLKYSDFMLRCSKENEDSIQIAFKPHPLLKEKLYKNNDWGKEKTDNYYEEWNERKNTFLYDSEYSSLFISSDAMIHDSGSFTAEYLALNKPVMFLVNQEETFNNFNSFGLECLKNHYHGRNVDDIEKFIRDVIKKGDDVMKSKRHNFIISNYILPNGNSASENIFNHLKKELT